MSLEGNNRDRTVPIINIAEVIRPNSNELNLKSPSISKVTEEVKKACIEWGFFYVVGHNVSEEFITELLSAAKEFFHKPIDFKKTVQRQPNNYRGYTDNELTKQKHDMKEAFDFGLDRTSEDIMKEKAIDLDMGENRWPPDMPEFKSILLKYFSKMHSLGTTLMSLIFMALGTNADAMKDNFNENNSTSFCRLNYYPVSEKGQNCFGVGPHSDAGVLTILLQDNNVSSLQVEKDGVFHDVTPIPGSFVINIGDMMQVWSNGLFKAPVHRVLASTGKERFSVPFFVNPSYETNVQPLEQCVSKDSPCRYRPVNWGVFRQGRILGDYADYGEEIQIHHFLI